MDSHFDQPSDFSSLLLEHEQYFPSDQPIVNFIKKEPIVNKKAAISAWNQQNYENDENSPTQLSIQSGLYQQRRRIQDFLTAIRSKNNQFNRSRSKYYNKCKNSSFGNINFNDNDKNQIFLHLNNTIITFPKSRSQSRDLQNQQKTILDKLYRKRQKSTIIVKQMSMSPSGAVGSTMKANGPVKDYLCKNRSFMPQNLPSKVYNPQSKQPRSTSGLRSRLTSSYFKKLSGVFHSGTKNQKMSNYEQQPRFSKSKSIQMKIQKVNCLNDEAYNQSPLKLYKTLYDSPKYKNLRVCNINQFSINQIRQQAKNTHLNRTKNVQRNQIQLLGSNIIQWGNQDKRRPNRVTKRKN